MGCGINDYVNKLTAELDKRKGSSPVAAAMLNDLNKIANLMKESTDKSDEIAKVNKGTTAEKHTAKELIKAKMANKYIGKGSVNSSTYRYMQVYGDKANMIEYTADDVVWVSSNGKRNGRVDPLGPDGIKTELDSAIDAGATIVMDTEAHIGKTGGYNIGEKALEEYMLNKGYTRDSSSGAGVWTKQEAELKLVKDSKTGLLGQEVNGKFTNAVKISTYEQLVELTKQYSKLLRNSLDSKDAVYYQELFDDIAKSGFGFKPITVKFENRAKIFNKAQGNAFKDERVDLSVDKQEGDANPVKLVLHEYAHIITAQELKKYPNLMKRTQQIMDNVREANPNIVKANPYAFTNEFEFIAEVVSSPKLQHALNKLTSDGVKLGLGDKVVQIFKNLLSRLTGKYDSSTLTDALEVVVALQEGKDAVVEQTELDKYLATYGGTDDISWMQEDETKPDNNAYGAEKPLEDGDPVKVYSQFDINSGPLEGKHITYHFSPENYANRKGPDELVPAGTKVDAYLTGKYADDRMTYYTAELEIDGKRITTQQDGKRPLHITVALGEGVKPFETGMHAEQHPELVEKIPEQKIEVEASVFKGKYNSKYDKTRPAEVEPKESAKQEADIIVPTDVFRKNINRKIECKE